MRTLNATDATTLQSRALDEKIMLLEFLGVKVSGATLKYTDRSKDVSWNGATYSRYPFEASGFSESLASDAPAATIILGSVDASQQARFFTDSFRGSRVKVTVIFLANASSASSTYLWQTTYTVNTDTAPDSAVTLQLTSADAVQGATVPRRQTNELGCQADYKRPITGCPYRGSMKSCDKTLDGPNGCRKHFPPIVVSKAPISTGNTTVQQDLPLIAFPGRVPHRVITIG